LAKEIGKEKDYIDFTKRIETLEKSIPAAFWNDEKGLFSDTVEMKYFSPHASLFAVRAGVVGDDKLKIIRKTLRPLLKPFFKNGYDAFGGGLAFTTSYGYYIFDSLYKAGMYDVAEYCMKEGWGWLLSRGLKTTPEHFTLEESQCHAWTASPVYMMGRYMLGVNFDIKEGLNNVTLDVKVSDVDWAKGAFPHPLGEIEVEWHKNENGAIVFDKIAAPDGVTVKIK
jgi:hypothetical protein